MRPWSRLIRKMVLHCLGSEAMADSTDIFNSWKTMFSSARSCLQGISIALSRSIFLSAFLLRRQSSERLRTEVVRYALKEVLIRIFLRFVQKLQKTSSTISSANSRLFTIRAERVQRPLYVRLKINSKA